VGLNNGKHFKRIGEAERWRKEGIERWSIRGNGVVRYILAIIAIDSGSMDRQETKWTSGTPPYTLWRIRFLHGKQRFQNNVIINSK
jgi:hypothetical protein